MKLDKWISALLDLVCSTLRNWLAAMVAVAILLFAAAMTWFQSWTYLISILTVGVISDLATSLFTAGGRGAPQIPATGSSRIQPPGYVYVAFLAGVVVVALLGAYIQSWILQNLTITDPVCLFLASSGAAILVWVDMRLRLYQR
jgi:hypothetical protein